MKKLATYVVASVALIGAPAFAADMAVKAPPPAPAPVYWTGWYVGVNAGASFGNVKTDFNAPVTITIQQLSQTPSSGTPVFAGSNREYPDGFIGGGQIGYNWQYSPLIVVGLEADFQGALEKDSNKLTGFPHANLSGGNVTGTVGFDGVLDYQTKIEWFGTVRPRIGYVWGDGTVMSYVTGGRAYGKVDLEGKSTAFT